MKAVFVRKLVAGPQKYMEDEQVVVVESVGMRSEELNLAECGPYVSVPRGALSIRPRG